MEHIELSLNQKNHHSNTFSTAVAETASATHTTRVSPVRNLDALVSPLDQEGYRKDAMQNQTSFHSTFDDPALVSEGGIIEITLDGFDHDEEQNRMVTPIKFKSKEQQTTTKPKLNLSVPGSTEKTVDLSSYLDASHELSLSMDSRASTLPNELFADVLEQLTDIAVAAGIVSTKSFQSTRSPVKGEPANNKRMEELTAELSMDGDEPGRIISAATSVEPSEVEEDYMPYDEELSNPNCHVRSEEEFSAIARMRYWKAVGKAGPREKKGAARVPSSTLTAPTTNHRNLALKKVDSKSSDNNPIETIQRWKNRREQVTKKEAQALNLNQRKASSNFTSNRKRRTKDSSSNTTTSGSMSEDSSDSPGLFDLSFLAKSLEEVWNQSQATVLEAVIGERMDHRDSESSAFEDSVDNDDDGSYGSSSSNCDDEYGDDVDNDNLERNKCRKDSKQTKRRRGRKKNNDYEEEEDEESLDDNDNHHDGLGGVANRNFLEVSVS